MDYINFFKDLLHQAEYGEYKYVILLVLLFLVPQILIRYAIPLGITAFGLGIFANKYLNYTFLNDSVINTFALLGIIVLFIHAGMDVDFKEMKKSATNIMLYLILELCIFFTIMFVMSNYLLINYSTAALFSLALITPSAGTILNSLNSIDITDKQKTAVKNFAISLEILALAILFIVSSPGDRIFMTISGACIILGVIILPPILKFYASAIAKFSPGSEFTLTVMLGLILGLLTKQIGAYYFIGAFLVGISAARYKTQANTHFTEDLIHALQLFASFFVPFYFFKTGLSINFDNLISTDSFIYGIYLFIFSFIIRTIPLIILRKISSNYSFKDSATVSIALLPNLVFGLVLFNLIRQTGEVEANILGALIIYTILISTLPKIILNFITVKKA